MFKALFTADWHLSNSLPHAVPDEKGVTDRFKDQFNMIEQIGGIAKEENVDAIFILGDIFDKSLLDPVTLGYATLAITDLAEIVPINILPGNHDAKNSKAQHYAVDFFSHLEVEDSEITVLDGDSYLEYGGYTFYSIPWMPLEETKEQIKKIKKSFRKDYESVVVLLHQSIIGCKVEDWTCDEGIDSNEFGAHIYLAGHFHEPQKFRNGMYIGAPMQKDFKDCGQKRRVVIGEFDKGDVKFYDRKIKSPEFHTVSFEPTKSLPFSPPNNGDYLRVLIQCTHSEYRVKLEQAKKYYSKTTEDIDNLHISYQHVPVSEHTVRMKTDGPMDYMQAISEYVKISEADLDNKKLLGFGRSILESVKDA